MWEEIIARISHGEIVLTYEVYMGKIELEIPGIWGFSREFILGFCFLLICGRLYFPSIKNQLYRCCCCFLAIWFKYASLFTPMLLCNIMTLYSKSLWQDSPIVIPWRGETFGSRLYMLQYFIC